MVVKAAKKFPHLYFRVAYSGSAFSGFQWQKDRPTLQAHLEESFQRYFPKTKLRVCFTSRTDAGVHAYDQLVFLKNIRETYEAKPLRQRQQLLSSLNYFSGDSVSFWEAGWLWEDFRATRDVLWKTYRYQVFQSYFLDPLLEKSFYWTKMPIDIKKLQNALKALEGRHDFSAFAKSSGKAAKEKKRGAVREILKTRVSITTHPRFKQAKILTIDITADGFLRYMVRNIVGTLLDEAQGRAVDSIAALESRHRPKAGKTAASHALILSQTKLRSASFISLT